MSAPARPTRRPAREAVPAPSAPDPHGLRPRAAALAMVAAVLDSGRSLDAARADAAVTALPPQERARAADLAGTVLRWLVPVDRHLAALMSRPPGAKARVARDALRLAVAEAAALGTPAHAAVDAAVRLAKADPGSAALSGLVNAVARRAVAAPPTLDPASALPKWLVARLRTAWGEAAPALLAALAEPAATDLTLRDPATAADWAARLGAERLPTGSLRLRAPGQITALPGFAEGAWWVQDAAAAIPARLLAVQPGERVLDLCAAPGGKTLQLAAAGGEVTALDADAQRLQRVADNLARTGLSARLEAADALAWHPEAPFPAILLDAPCSATGTLRRHPDLVHLRRDSDIATLAALQDRLLDAAWAMLAPGGRLVFCTCSLLPEEGEERAAAFLARTPEAQRVAQREGEAGDPAFLTAAGDLRTRPDQWAGAGGLDGFFAARFVRG